MRTVFFISDSTGITAETLGRSLLSQFEGMKFRQTRVPFVDSVDNALDCVERMTEAKMRDGERPIVVTSIVNAEVARTVRQLPTHQAFIDGYCRAKPMAEPPLPAQSVGARPSGVGAA